MAVLAETGFVDVEPKSTGQFNSEMEGQYLPHLEGDFSWLCQGTLWLPELCYLWLILNPLAPETELSLRDEKLRIRQCEKPQTNHRYHYKILFCAKCYAKSFDELYKLTLGKDYWCQSCLFSASKHTHTHIQRERGRDPASEMLWYLAFTFIGCWPWNERWVSLVWRPMWV